MADFIGGSEHKILPGQHQASTEPQIVSLLKRFNAHILLRSWEYTPVEEGFALKFRANPLQNILKLEPTFVASLDKLLRRIGGHGSSAVVNSNYLIRSIKEIKECEYTRFFTLGVTTNCSKNEIFLGILARRLNVTFVPGRFIQIRHSEFFVFVSHFSTQIANTYEIMCEFS